MKLTESQLRHIVKQIISEVIRPDTIPYDDFSPYTGYHRDTPKGTRSQYVLYYYSPKCGWEVERATSFNSAMAELKYNVRDYITKANAIMYFTVEELIKHYKTNKFEMWVADYRKLNFDTINVLIRRDYAVKAYNKGIFDLLAEE